MYNVSLYLYINEGLNQRKAKATETTEPIL